MSDFFREFFCEDHGPSTITTTIVILNPYEPSEELLALLSDPLYTNRIKYVKGSVMSFRSLDKVKAKEAKAVFIFAGWTGERGDIGDAEGVMRALVITHNIQFFFYI